MASELDGCGPPGSSRVPARFGRMVSIGDSFTEGMGDELPDGRPRGWADLTATVVADEYANLAIRGRLLGPILDEQLEPALALRPDMVTFNGGGNDMMRPRTDPVGLQRLVDLVVARLQDRGITPVLLAGANPSAHLPFGRRLQANGDLYTGLIRRIADRRGVLLVDMWTVVELRDLRFWSADHLHLNSHGHARVAARVVRALGHTPPDAWEAPVPPVPEPQSRIRESAQYYREHVLPWVRRRLSGRSSGDGRPPKFATPIPTAELSR